MIGRLRTLDLTTTLLAVLWSSGVTAEPGFFDRADDVGLRFKHEDGRSGKRYILETLGAGVALFDCDGDGWLDVYCVSGTDLPGKKSPKPARNALFRNRGDGSFEDITERSGTGDPGYGFGCCVGDYDGDGLLDLFATNFGKNALYRNQGGCRFVNVTSKAGLADTALGWSTGAAFLDFNNDGHLDLFVANYMVFEVTESPRPCWAVPDEIPGYCHPQKFAQTQSELYRNNGDGTFTNVTAQTGLKGNLSKSLGVVCGDYDRDGDTDIFVANDTLPNFLFENVEGRTFRDSALFAGVAFAENGLPESGMGVDFADYDGDGWLDFGVTNFSQETNSLYRSHEGQFFSENSYTSKTGKSSHQPMGWGTGFFDFDRDGLRDWFVANGHLQDNLHLFIPGASYAQHGLLFRNTGGGIFENLSTRGGPAMGVQAVGRGAAFGDVDNDGDIDIVVSNSNGPLRYLRCEGDSKNHWLSVSLRQPGPNRFAVGARVTVRAGKLLLVDEVQTGGSYLSHNDFRLHFGLGQQDRVSEIEVRWPDGAVEKRSDIGADQFFFYERKVASRSR